MVICVNKCIFCAIAKGEAAAEVLYRDDSVMAFRDRYPQAPDHLLIIPLRHVSSASEMDDPELWGKIMSLAVRLGHDLGLERQGYRLIVNNGVQACQTIPHLHVHLMSGRQFGWPPG